MTDKSVFEDSVNGLLKHVEELIGDVSIYNPVVKEDQGLFGNYQRVFSKTTDKSKHYTFYRKLLEENKASILSSTDDTAWLKGNAYVKCTSTNTSIQLKLSFFYLKALHYAEVVRKSLEGLPQANQGHKALARPEQIKLQLLKIFTIVAEAPEDKLALQAKISETERKIQGLLSIGIAASAEAASTSQPAANGPIPSMPPIGDALGGIIGMVGNYMKNSGIQLPPPPPGVQGGGAPDMSGMMDTINKLVTGGALNKLLEGVIGQVTQMGIIPGVAPGPAPSPSFTGQTQTNAASSPTTKKDPLAVSFAPIPPTAGTNTIGIVETGDTLQVSPPEAAAPVDTPTTGQSETNHVNSSE